MPKKINPEGFVVEPNTASLLSHLCLTKALSKQENQVNTGTEETLSSAIKMCTHQCMQILVWKYQHIMYLQNIQCPTSITFKYFFSWKASFLFHVQSTKMSLTRFFVSQ